MQVDELQLRFKINERALLDGLIKSASTVSDEFADELSKKFEAAINKVTKRGQTVMQLGGLFVNLFNEFSEAAGDVDKLSSAMDNLVNRFEFLSNIEKKSGVKGLLNEFNVSNMDKLLDYYDKMYEAEEKIQKIREKNSRDQIKQNAQKKVRSVDDLLKMGRGEKDDSKDLRDYVKKYIDDAIKENEKLKPTSTEDANKLLAISRQYADLVSAYKKLLKEAPKKGSEEAVTQQLEIISILTELKKYEQKNVVLANFRKNIEKELPDDFKNIQKEASTIEIQGLTLAINNMVTALVKPLQTQIAKIYEEAIEKATGIAIKKGEDIMQTYEEAVKVFNLQEEKSPASKKRVGIAKKIPTQFGGVSSAINNVEEEIDKFSKYYQSLEDAKTHIAELINDRNVKATTVDSNNFEKIKDLIGYIQGYISLGGQIEDLNLDKTTLRRFNLQGMSTNYANQISAIKNTIIDAFKQVATNNYGSIGNAESVNSAVANEVSTNPNANITGGLSNESVVKLVSELNVIKNEILQYQEKIGTDIINKINETNRLIETDLVNNLSAISNNIIDIGNKISNIDNVPQNITNTYGNIADIIVGMMNADMVMKQNEIPLHERGMFYNSKTKQHTNEFIYGDEHSFKIGILNKMAEQILADSMMHSHTGKYASMSFVTSGEKGDLFTFKKYKDKGINQQIIAAQDNIQIFDAKSFYDKYGDFFDNVTQETLKSIEEQIKTEAESIVFSPDPDREQELVDIISQIKIPFESFISNYDELPQEIKDEIGTGDFQNKIIDTIRNAKNNIWESISDFEKVNGLEDFDIGDALSNWISSTENGMILIYQKAQENILKKFLNDDNFKMSDYSSVLSLDDFKEKYGDNETELSIIVELLKEINSSLSNIDFSGMKDEIETLKESVMNLSSILPNNSDLSKTNTNGDVFSDFIPGDEKFDNIRSEISETKKSSEELLQIWEKLRNEFTDPFDDLAVKSKGNLYAELKKQLESLGYSFNGETQEWIESQISTGNTAKDFYEKYGTPSQALDAGSFAKVREVLDELGGRFKQMDETAEDFSERKLNVEFLKDLTSQLGLSEDQLIVIKQLFTDIETILPGGEFAHLTDAIQNAKVIDDELEKIKSIVDGTYIVTEDDVNNAKNLLQIATEYYNKRSNETPVSTEVTPVLGKLDEPINQDSPAPLKVKPVLDPQEFADEVTEQLKDSYAQINIKPKNDDPNTFVTEVTQSLNGWNANIAVQPQIDWPTDFAESVSEQIQSVAAKITVEPLPEGEFDSERFAQQVTNRLIGETAKIDVDFSENKDNLNINGEIENLSGLKSELDDITRIIGLKTAAFVNEKGEVEKAVNIEKSRLTELKNVVEGVTSAVNEKTQAFKNEAQAVNAVLRTEEKQQKQSRGGRKKKEETPEEKQKREYEESWAKTRKQMEAAEKDYALWQKKQEEKRKKEEQKNEENNLSKFKKYQNQYNQLSDSSNTDLYPEKYKEQLKKIWDIINNINKLDIVEDSDLKQLDEAFNDLSKIDKLASGANVSNYIVKIEKMMQSNSKMSTETRLRLESFIDALKDPQLEKGVFKNIVKEINDLEAGMIRAGEAGKSLFQAISEKAFWRTAQYIATFFSFQDWIRYTKQLSQNVINLNTQFTELAKVSDSTIKQLEKDFKSYADTAKDVGGTISDTISATADWARMGYNLPDSKELARVALIYKNVGDGIDISTANESLISTLQGFQMEAKDAMHIIDVFNETSNNFAISSSGIGEALKRSAASFNAANTSLEESVALVTTTNTVLQDPSVVGNLWKTMSARIRGKIVPHYNENYNLCFE